MSPGERDALLALERRLSHVAATASLLAEHIESGPMAEALFGIAATLNEQRTSVGEVLTGGAP